MFAKSMYQDKVDKLVRQELEKTDKMMMPSADKIHREQSTQYKINQLMKTMEEVR